MKYYLVAVVLVISICSAYGTAKWTLPSKYYTLSYGNDVIMKCKVTGTFVGFFHEADTTKKIESGERISIDNVEAGTYTLDIRKLKEEDYGKYYCNDSVSADVATLSIAATVPDLEPQQKLALGHEGVIRAKVYAMPKVPITWSRKKDGSLTEIAKINEDGTPENIAGSERYEVTQRGALIIKKVEDDDAGSYVITALSDFSRVTKDTIVQVGSKPSLSVSPKKVYTVTQKLNLTIPCDWVGASTVTEWTFKDNSGSEVEVTEGVHSTGLTLTAVEPSAEGNYTCKSSNDYGNSSIEVYLKQVIIPAEITSGFPNASVVQGTFFNLSCEASGTPSPVVRIFKVVETNLASGAGKAVVSFPDLNTNDKGQYTCHADNGAETADGQSRAAVKKMLLEILTPPMIETSEMTTKKVSSAVGRSFSIQCTARGNPNPSVKLVKDNVDITTNVTMQYGAVTASFQVESAVKENFGTIDCIATNDHGKKNASIVVMEVVKASAPTGLSVLKDIGLEYVDLTWEVVDDADSYIVYINETREEKTIENSITVTGLKRSTYYSFKVASVNLAGVGNASTPVTFRTSDITVPGVVTGFDVREASYNEMEVKWNAPTNVDDSDLMIYEVTYCEMVNDTSAPRNCQKKKSKDTRVDLVNLKPDTKYEVEIKPSNQGVEGEISKFQVETQAEPTTEPVPSGSDNGGLGSGAVAGIIIVVILIILVVVDMFCCYFNHCGFTHCCFETCCAAKTKKKYAPADKEDAEELKPKINETV